MRRKLRGQSGQAFQLRRYRQLTARNRRSDMLAQNFKTAAELKLTEDERAALVTVLGMLEREEIPEHAFTMKHFRPIWTDQYAKVATECGTVGCLCGWANHVSGGKV